jgi:hypothetical protein
MSRIPTVTLQNPDTGDNVVVNDFDVEQWKGKGFTRRVGETLGETDVVARSEPSEILGADGAPAVEADTSEPSLDDMSKLDLIEAAKALGVTGSSSMNKANLARSIEAAQSAARAESEAETGQDG